MPTVSQVQRASRNPSVLSFVGHLAIASLAVPMLATYLTGYAFDILRLVGKTYPAQTLYEVLSGTPYFPVQIFIGVMVGWVVSRYFFRPIMLWVWILPFAFLVYAFAAIPTLFPNITAPEFQVGIAQSRFSHYFGWGCRPTNHCPDQLFVTLPFYAAGSYSLGALAGATLFKGCRLKTSVLFWLLLFGGILLWIAFFSELLEIARVGWNLIYLPVLVVALAGGAFLILWAMSVRQESVRSGLD